MIEICYKGTPTPNDLGDDFQHKLDPLSWNKHFQQQKSLRFSPTKPSKTENFEFLRLSLSTVKPRKEVESPSKNSEKSSKMRNYQRSRGFAHFPSKVEKNPDIYGKYTTASSFRKSKTTEKIDPTPRFSSNKLFDADALNISPKLTFSNNQGKSEIPNELGMRQLLCAVFSFCCLFSCGWNGKQLEI